MTCKSNVYFLDFCRCRNGEKISPRHGCRPQQTGRYEHKPHLFYRIILVLFRFELILFLSEYFSFQNYACFFCCSFFFVLFYYYYCRSGCDKAKTNATAKTQSNLNKHQPKRDNLSIDHFVDHNNVISNNDQQCQKQNRGNCATLLLQCGRWSFAPRSAEKICWQTNSNNIRGLTLLPCNHTQNFAYCFIVKIIRFVTACCIVH